MKGCGGSDGVLICAGTIRGDSTYGPGNVCVVSVYAEAINCLKTGNIALGDILEILPWEDPIVVLEIDGETLWNALEASLATWPAQEG